jgi:hypothetical protein
MNPEITSPEPSVAQRAIMEHLADEDAAAIRDIIAGFQAQRWQSEPMDKALRLATRSPDSILTFARAVLDDVPEGGTFLDAALAFLPEAHWSALVAEAVAHLQRNPKNEAAQSVVSYASLQCVGVLHPFLSDLFVLDDLSTAYYAPYPWRESGRHHLAFLEQQLRVMDGTSSAPDEPARGYRAPAYTDRRERALCCLLETRQPEAIEIACSAAAELGHTPEEIGWRLHAVDHEYDEERRLRGLVPPVVRHLQFDKDYVERPGYLGEWPFPTWEAPPLAQERRFRFGGVLAQSACALCGGSLHHLLTLDPLPQDLGMTNLPRLVLATCLSCLGWEEEVLFFVHDAPQGTPTSWNLGAAGAESRRTPQFPSPPLEETRVALVETPRRWRWQDWGLSNGREDLFRVGGHPCWIQNAAYPACPKCQRTMPFLLQLDSDLRLEGGDSWLWGSGGIAYLFWCDTCRVSASLWQCT